MGRGRFWTESELAFLNKNLGTMPVSDIAVKLGRSLESVYQKSFRLNLSAFEHLHGKPVYMPFNAHSGVSFREALPPEKHNDMLLFLYELDKSPIGKKANIHVKQLRGIMPRIRECASWMN
jgi:hypothetical protein